MSKKDLIKKLLDKLSEEDLQDLLDAEETEELQHRPNKQAKAKPKRARKNRQSIDNYDNEEDSESIHHTRKRKNFCRKEQMNISRKRKNIFRNQISELGLDISERKELEKASKDDESIRQNFTPISRRPPLKMVNVKCSMCGTRETVSPVLVRDMARYRCNDCETGR